MFCLLPERCIEKVKRMSNKELFNKANSTGRAMKFRNATVTAKVDLLGELKKAGLKDLGE